MSTPTTLLRLSLVFAVLFPFYAFSQKCIDLGTGIEMANDEYALIDFFKNNQHWQVVGSDDKEWYACDNLDEFKVVNGAYYHYDKNWSCDVDNDTWGEPWDDTYISYWNMMVDQGKIREDGYPIEFPTTVYKYHTKTEDPEQGIDESKPVELTKFTRRMYFPKGIPQSGWVMKWKGTGKLRFQGMENAVGDAGTVVSQSWESWTPAGQGFAGYNYDLESSGEGRLVTDLHYMIHGWVLEIQESDPNDPIRDIVFLFPGLEDEYDAGQIFHPQYIERMKQFSSLRYMGYLKSNGIESRRVMAECNPFFYKDMTEYLRWEERTAENYYCLDNGNGGNYEYIIALSNQTKTDPWINIPYCASPDYAEQLVNLFMEKLDPDLTLYLEVGNEMWNFAPGFQGFRWQAAFRQLHLPGLGDVEARGAFINDIFQRVTEVAGAANLPRIQRIYGAFPRYTDINNRSLSYIDPNHWDALATTWYFSLSQDADNSCPDPATGTNWRSTLYNWWENNPNDQAGFNEKYKECLLGEFRCHGGYSGNSDVVLANFYGKYTVCYEGGNHTFYGCENGPTGGELSGELEFDDPLYPDYITNNGFINAIAVADESEEVAEVYEEVIDSMQSAGIKLANHLSFSGRSSCYGVWSFIQPRDLDKDLDYLLENYPKFRVFSERIQNNNCTQLEIVLEEDTVGAGLAIKLDGVNDYINSNLNDKFQGVDDYTFEAWVKPTYENVDHAIMNLSAAIGSLNSNTVRIREDNKLIWEIEHGDEVTFKLVGTEIALNTWNHIVAIKNGERYTLYVNGTAVASKNAMVISATPDNVVIGGSLGKDLYFGGEIDEVRLWQSGRSREEIREYMCKKIPDTYSQFSDLIAYYRFDKPDYETFTAYDQTTKTATAELKNITITKPSRYTVSGAALGDYSKYIYPSLWNNVSLSLKHADGDMVAVSNLGSGSPEGVHVYMIHGKSYYNDPPEFYDGISESRSVGVFTVNGNGAAYDVRYMYAGNPDELLGEAENNHRLLRKDDYASEFWLHSGAEQDLVANTLTVTCSETYRGEYILAFREANNPVRPGSGMALKNNQVPTGNIDGQLLYLDLEDYTVSFWAQGWGEVFNFTEKFHQHEQKFGISPAYGEGLNCGMRFSYNHSNTQYLSPSGRVADLQEWKHYAITRKGSKVTIYVNGEEVASDNILTSFPIKEMHLFNDPSWQDGNYIDGKSNLTIDELRVWNTPLDENTIREWMCKKINGNHPYECENLVLYFNFDEGEGSVIEDKHGPSDIVLSTDDSGFEWVKSGAAVGDESVYDYISPEHISMEHPQGDVFEAERTSGISSGVHLYRIDNMPPDPAEVPEPEILSIDSTRYWGIYVVDAYKSTNGYTVTNHYAENKQVNLLLEEEVRMAYRYENAAEPWQVDPTTPPNLTDQTVHIETQERGEYMLVGVSENTFNEYIPPLFPVFVTESADTNISSFCGNQTELLFAVEPNDLVETYLWILPDEIDGYSTSDTIIVNAIYTGTGIVNTQIGVVAINSYGESDTAFYDIEIMPQPTIADAGPDQVLLPPANSFIMDGNTPSAQEEGMWIVVEGSDQVASINDPKTEIENPEIGISKYIWNISNGVCPASVDSVEILFAPKPEAIKMADGSDVQLSYCAGETINLQAIPMEDIEPDGYEWSLPNGMQLLSQTGNEAEILIEGGYGGAIEVSAVYNDIQSEAFVSEAIGISELPEKPVFDNPVSILCHQVDQVIALEHSAKIDSVVWTLPYGILPTEYPKSTSPNIEVQSKFMVEGYIKAQAYLNGCTSTEVSDSIYITVNVAPDKPILVLGTDGGTADGICRNEDALLWVDNNDPAMTYEWQWNPSISFKEYFGDNKNGALFTMPGGNAEILVRAVSAAEGCNKSEWYDFYGWAQGHTPSSISSIQIIDPAGQATDDLQVGETYTIEVSGTGENYFWNLPEGFAFANDADINDNTNTIEVISETAASLEVYPITVKGCAGEPQSIELSVSGTLLPPEYISGETKICQSTNLQIEVTDVGATEYTWTLPDGTEYTTTTNSLNETVLNPQTGIMTVVASNGIYESIPAEIEIKVMAAVIPETGFSDVYGNPISDYEVCSGDSKKPIYHRDMYAESYVWGIQGSAIEFSPRWEPGFENDRDYEMKNRTSPVDTMMAVSWSSWRVRDDGTDGGYIYITAKNGCGGEDVTDSISYYWVIPMDKQVPEFTLMPTELCVGSTVSYQIEELPFAEEYIWKMPGGLVVDDVVTTQPSITADVVNGLGGEIEVYAISDYCGSSQSVTQVSDMVTISGEPVDLHFIDAPTAACKGETLTFTVNEVGSGVYNWILPDGLNSDIIDAGDPSTEIVGSWQEDEKANMVNGNAYWASNYGTSNTITFNPEIATTGKYRLSVSYYSPYNVIANVPVTVNHADGSNVVIVNMKLEPQDGIWQPLGEFNFIEGGTASVTIGTVDVDGGVTIVDALKIEAVGIEDDNTMDLTVSSDEGGAVCVQTVTENCASPYTVCTDPINLTGELESPLFVDQETSVCEGKQYLFRVNDIGADEYIWTLPNGMSINGETGEVTTTAREVMVDMDIDPESPVQISVKGIISSCGIESESVSSGDITFDGSDCKLQTPVFILPEEIIVEPELITYTVTVVEFAEEYVWILPEGLQQAGTAETGEITTTGNTIEVEIDGTLYGKTDSIKVVAKASGLEDSDTAYTPFGITLEEMTIAEAQFSINETEMCPNDTLKITDESTGADRMLYNWQIKSEHGIDEQEGELTEISLELPGEYEIQLALINAVDDTVSKYSQTLIVHPRPEFESIIIPDVCNQSTGILTINYPEWKHYFASVSREGVLVDGLVPPSQVNRMDIDVAAGETIFIDWIHDEYCKTEIDSQIVINSLTPVSATISGDVEMYSGETAELQVDFTGEGLWNITLSNGHEHLNIMDNPLIIEVAEDGTYTLDTVYNATCGGTTSGEATVTYLGYEYATISGDTAICENGKAQVRVDLEGTGPWEIVIYNGFRYDTTISNITESPFIYETGNYGWYSLSSVVDGNLKPLQLAGEATVSKIQGTYVERIMPIKGCLAENSGLEIRVNDENIPGIITLTHSSGKEVSFPFEEADFEILGLDTGFYNIKSIEDQICISESYINTYIGTYDSVYAEILGDTIIQEGDTAELKIIPHGNGAPYTITLSDGEVYEFVLEDTLIVQKTDAGIYTVESILDRFCSGTGRGSATITYENRPTATLQGGGEFCFGDIVDSVRVELTGIAPWTVSYSLTEGADPLVITTSDPIFVLDLQSMDSVELVSVIDVDGTEGTVSGKAGFIVYERSTLTINDTVICAGTVADMELSFAGTAPWSVIINDSEYIDINDQTLLLEDVEAGVYTITEFSDANCNYISNQSFSVDEYDAVSAVISGEQSFCDIENSSLTVGLTGTAPWTLEIQTSGGIETHEDINESPFYIALEQGVYGLHSVSDANCNGEVDTDALVYVNHIEKPDIEDLETLWGDEPVIVNEDGDTLRWYEDPSLQHYLVEHYQFEPDVSEIGVYTYFVTRTDGYCESDADSVTLKVNPNTHIIGNDEVCAGVELQYYAPLNVLLDYEWSITGGTIVEQGRNTIRVIWNETDEPKSLQLTETHKIDQSVQNSYELPITVGENVPVTYSVDLDQCEQVAHLEITNADPAHKYIWVAETGTIDASENGAFADISFADAGTHNISLQETYSLGCFGSSDDIAITISEHSDVSFEYIEQTYKGVEYEINHNAPIGTQFTLQGDLSDYSEYSQTPNSLLVETNKAGIYNYAIQYKDINTGCIYTDELQKIHILETPSVKIIGETKFCNTVETKFYIRYDNQFLMKWGTIVESESRTQDDSLFISFENGGVKTITASLYDTTVTENPISTAELQVYVIPTPQPHIVGEENICSSDKQLDYYTEENDDKTYDWFIYSSPYNSTIYKNELYVVFKDAGEYEIVVSETEDDEFCQGRDTLIVTVGQSPDLLGIDTVKHCFAENGEIEVKAEDGFDNYYQDGEVVSQPIETFNEPGYLAYSVIEGECETLDTIYVVDGCAGRLSVPDAFSPNGDGLNDKLQVFSNNINKLEFVIVNKWGETVFKALFEDDFWDGTYNGEDAPLGSYTWQASYKTSEGEDKLETGKVVLIR